MRTYRVSIDIVSTDKGPSETTQVVLNVSANSIQELVDHANKTIPTFGAMDVVAEHNRLVSEQNKEPSDAEPDSK